jgi:hypothetical protein
MPKAALANMRCVVNTPKDEAFFMGCSARKMVDQLLPEAP